MSTTNGMSNIYQLETVICGCGSSLQLSRASRLSKDLPFPVEATFAARSLSCGSMADKASSKRPWRASGSTAARSSASGSKDESRSSRDAEMAPEQ
eukprot:2425910-Prymnesium_polylepis.1